MCVGRLFDMCVWCRISRKRESLPMALNRRRIPSFSKSFLNQKRGHTPPKQQQPNTKTTPNTNKNKNIQLTVRSVSRSFEKGKLLDEPILLQLFSRVNVKLLHHQSAQTNHQTPIQILNKQPTTYMTSKTQIWFSF